MVFTTKTLSVSSSEAVGNGLENSAAREKMVINENIVKKFILCIMVPSKKNNFSPSEFRSGWAMNWGKKGNCKISKMKGHYQNQCLAVILIHGTVITIHDGVQQSAVNVNIHPVHAVGGEIALFLKNTEDNQIPVFFDNQS